MFTDKMKVLLGVGRILCPVDKAIKIHPLWTTNVCIKFPREFNKQLDRFLVNWQTDVFIPWAFYMFQLLKWDYLEFFPCFISLEIEHWSDKLLGKHWPYYLDPVSAQSHQSTLNVVHVWSNKMNKLTALRSGFYLFYNLVKMKGAEGLLSGPQGSGMNCLKK